MTVSRLLAAAGLVRSKGRGDGFSVRRNRVVFSYRLGPAGRLERDMSLAVEVLRGRGYLVLADGTGSAVEVYRAVRSAAHEEVFYTDPWASKVVDTDGSVRKGTEDPETAAVLAERDAARQRRDVEERAVTQRAQERRDALIAVFGELGVAAGKHRGVYSGSTDIHLGLDAAEKLLGLARAGRASSPAPRAVPGGDAENGSHCPTGRPLVAAPAQEPPADRPGVVDNRAIVHRLLLAAAKARSALAEAGTLNIGLSPFLDDGDLCILPTLSALDGLAEPPSFIETLNLLIIADRAEPTIGICAVGYGGVPTPAQYMDRRLVKPGAAS